MRKQVEVLESRIAEHEARAESFTDILSSQRSTFRWGIILITILATVLFGVVGWGIFEWRAGYIEESLQEGIDSFKKRTEENINKLEENITESVSDNKNKINNTREEIERLDNRLIKVEIDNQSTSLDYLDERNLHISYVDSGLSLVLKILDAENKNIGHGLMMHNIMRNIEDKVKNEIDNMDKETYGGIIDKFKGIIDRTDDDSDTAVRKLLVIFEDEVEVEG